MRAIHVNWSCLAHWTWHTSRFFIAPWSGLGFSEWVREFSVVQ
jgi:hypothetical protein